MANTNGAASPLITSISLILPKISFLMTGVLALSLIWTTLAPSKVYADSKFPIRGDESIMSQKEHGTSNYPVQANLRWKVDNALADRIVNFNRRYAEYSGYWSQETELIKEINDHIAKNDNNPIQFYDSVTGKLIFTAPIGRTYEEFKEESLSHGWPSFRDNEVHWENVRTLKDNEVVSLSGSHLGHNIPDRKGNRYCINLVSVAGNPVTSTSQSEL